MTDNTTGADQEAVPATEAGPATEAAPATVSPISGPEVKPTPAHVKERVFVGTGLFWGLVVGVLLAVAVIILAAQNTARTTISFLGWEFSTPLIVVILGSLLVGVIFDELFGLVYRSRRRRTLAERDRLRRIERANAESNAD
jgi:uncharacterized integral membrane protein